MKVRPSTAGIAGVVALVIVVVAGVVILSHDLTPGARMIVIQGMLTGVLTTVTALLAVVKADQAAGKAEEMHHDLQNGLIPEKVKEAVNEMAADPNQPGITFNSDDNGA